MGAGVNRRDLITAGLTRASDTGFRRSADNAGPRWSIALSDGYDFSIVQDDHGAFPTRDAAIDGVIRHLERISAEVTHSLARARRMCSRTRRLKAALNPKAAAA